MADTSGGIAQIVYADKDGRPAVWVDQGVRSAMDQPLRGLVMRAEAVATLAMSGTDAIEPEGAEDVRRQLEAWISYAHLRGAKDPEVLERLGSLADQAEALLAPGSRSVQ